MAPEPKPVVCAHHTPSHHWLKIGLIVLAVIATIGGGISAYLGWQAHVSNAALAAENRELKISLISQKRARTWPPPCDVEYEACIRIGEDFGIPASVIAAIRRKENGHPNTLALGAHGTYEASVKLYPKAWWNYGTGAVTANRMLWRWFLTECPEATRKKGYDYIGEHWLASSNPWRNKSWSENVRILELEERQKPGMGAGLPVPVKPASKPSSSQSGTKKKA